MSFLSRAKTTSSLDHIIQSNSNNGNTLIKSARVKCKHKSTLFMLAYLAAFTLLIFVLSSQFAFAQSFDDHGVKVEVVADNLQVPWAMVFSPDGRIFFTERIGSVRIIENNHLNPDPVASFNVGTVEGGLLGIALDPNFEENHYVYLYQTYNEFLSTYNRVARYTEDDNKLSNEMILIDKIPGAAIHDGGRLKFGPDNKLYITTGDARNSRLAQDLDSVAGKILRINSDGTIPDDNPFKDSSVFSLGHRNPHGLDWDPISGRLVISEHGPSGERGFAHDEINVIEKGKNYGWPDIVGDETKERLEKPIVHSGSDTWAPSGATFYDSDKIPGWKGKFFVATLRGNHLRVLDLDLNENKVISSESIFAGQFGRLRDVVSGPDGNLYLLTSNRDGRGNPVSNDDRILRISPLQEHENEFVDLSPLKQVQKGIEPKEVNCKQNLVLVIKSHNNSPACVTSGSAKKLEERGWGFLAP